MVREERLEVPTQFITAKKLHRNVYYTGILLKCAAPMPSIRVSECRMRSLADGHRSYTTTTSATLATAAKSPLSNVNKCNINIQR